MDRSMNRINTESPLKRSVTLICIALLALQAMACDSDDPDSGSGDAGADVVDSGGDSADSHDDSDADDNDASDTIEPNDTQDSSDGSGGGDPLTVAFGYRGIARSSAFTDDMIVGYSQSCLDIYDVAEVSVDGETVTQLMRTFRDDEANDNSIEFPVNDDSSFRHAVIDGDGDVWVVAENEIRAIDPTTGATLQSFDPRDPDGEDDPHLQIAGLPGGGFAVRGRVGDDLNDTVFYDSDGAEVGRLEKEDLANSFTNQGRLNDLLHAPGGGLVGIQGGRAWNLDPATGANQSEIVDIGLVAFGWMQGTFNDDGDLVAAVVDDDADANNGKPHFRVVDLDGTILEDWISDVTVDRLSWPVDVEVVGDIAVLQTRPGPGFSTGNLVAIDLSDGSSPWNEAFEDENLGTNGGTLGALSDGTIVFSYRPGTGDTVITGLDAADGSERWSQTIDGAFSQLLVDDHDRIHVSSPGGAGCQSTTVYEAPGE